MKLTIAITTVLSLCLSAAACAPERPAAEEPAIATAADRERPPSSPPVAAAEPAPVLDPCALISTDELRQVTGIDFAPGRQTANEANLARCAWAPSGSTQDGVVVAVHTGDADAVWKRYFAMPGTQGLAGLGDEAIMNTAMQHLVTRSGDRVLVVNPNLPQAAIRRAAEEIARTVLPRMESVPSQ